MREIFGKIGELNNFILTMSLNHVSKGYFMVL